MTPDVNVLVSAYRPDHPYHLPARRWLEETVQQVANGQSRLNLLGMVLSGFIRTTMHPKVFRETDSFQKASGFLDSLLSCPGVQYQALSASWPQWRAMCLTQHITADWVSDAWLAATVIQSDETLCTFDANFARLLPASQMILLKP